MHFSWNRIKWSCTAWTFKWICTLFQSTSGFYGEKDFHSFGACTSQHRLSFYTNSSFLSYAPLWQCTLLTTQPEHTALLLHQSQDDWCSRHLDLLTCRFSTLSLVTIGLPLLVCLHALSSVSICSVRSEQVEPHLSSGQWGQEVLIPVTWWFGWLTF